MIDAWRELFDTLARHGLRTALTLLSVAWGTFVLVVLLGAGVGLQNSVKWQFRDDATNSLWIYRGETSKPWEGHPIGRGIRFDNRDLDAVRRAVPDIEHWTGRFYLGGSSTVAYQGRSNDFGIRSVHPGHRYLENTIVTRGRFVDDLDLVERRKVTVIGEPVARFLFRGEDPLGKHLTVAGVPFQVVGLFHDEGGENEAQQVYLPITTAQAAFGGYQQVHQIMFTVGEASVEDALAIEASVRSLLAERHHFDPEDPQAVRVRNNVEQFERIRQIFTLLDSFVWLVGVGTVMAGIVGVSNIMLVSVRERTAEIGLRKALGATPGAIVGAIVQEAVLLTAVAGYVGIVGGVAVLALLRATMPENDYLRDPEVRLGPAVVAAALLVLFGALAGMAPALRAARIHPAEALRDEV